jgi:hypothetical protein
MLVVDVAKELPAAQLSTQICSVVDIVYLLCLFFLRACLLVMTYLAVLPATWWLTLPRSCPWHGSSRCQHSRHATNVLLFVTLLQDCAARKLVV